MMIRICKRISLLHCAIFPATCLATHCGKSVEIVAFLEPSSTFYNNCRLQHVSQRFQPLLTLCSVSCDLSRDGVARQVDLSDKLHEILHGVTALFNIERCYVQ